MYHKGYPLCYKSGNAQGLEADTESRLSQNPKAVSPLSSGAKSNQSPLMKESLQFIALVLLLAVCAYVALFLAQAF